MSDPEVLDRRLRRLEQRLDDIAVAFSGRREPASDATDGPSVDDRFSEMTTRMEKLESGENEALRGFRGELQELIEGAQRDRDNADISHEEICSRLEKLESHATSSGAPFQSTDGEQTENRPENETSGRKGGKGKNKGGDQTG